MVETTALQLDFVNGLFSRALRHHADHAAWVVLPVKNGCRSTHDFDTLQPVGLQIAIADGAQPVQIHRSIVRNGAEAPHYERWRT